MQNIWSEFNCIKNIIRSILVLVLYIVQIKASPGTRPHYYQTFVVNLSSNPSIPRKSNDSLEILKNFRLRQPLSPGGEPLADALDQLARLVKALAAVVPKLAEQLYVLEQLFAHKVGHAGAPDALEILLIRQLVEPGVGAILREGAPEVHQHLFKRLVLGGGQHATAQQRVAVQHDRLYVLARVAHVVQGHRRRDGPRHGKRPGVVGTGLAEPHWRFEVAQVKACQEERGRDAEAAHVGVDLGLAVKVVDLCELSLAHVCDVDESAPDEVLDSCFL